LNGEAGNICRILGWKFIEIPDRQGRRWKNYVKTYFRQILVRSLNSFRIIFKSEYVLMAVLFRSKCPNTGHRSPR